MRRLLSTLAGSVLVIGLLVPTAGAGDDKRTADRPKDDRRGASLVLYASETSTVTISPTGVVDPPEDDPGAFAPGARFLSVDVLFSDRARTRAVGRNDISCTTTQVTGTPTAPGAATLLCSGVVRLDGQGSLAWQGSLTFDASEQETGEPFAVVAITGGTGTFRAAGGQVAVFDESQAQDETLSRYELDLLRLRQR